MWGLCRMTMRKYMYYDQTIWMPRLMWALDVLIWVAPCRNSLIKAFFIPNRIFLFFFFFLIWVLQPFQEYFTYIKPIIHQRWAKTEEPRKNHLTIRKHNFAFSSNRIIWYYRMYEWRAKARIILCACAGWSESVHLRMFESTFLLDEAHMHQRLLVTWHHSFR